MELPTPAARTVRDVRYDFSGKTVLITGVARGVGRSHALAFAEAGANLVVCDLETAVAGLEETAEKCRDAEATTTAVVCDVSDSRQVAGMVQTAMDEHGQIDVLLNNAGMIDMWSAVEMSEEVWDRVIDVNLKGPFLCAKYVAPHMIEAGRGKIINTGSGASLLGVPLLSHYTAAKHGVAGFSKSLAIELAPYGITVNYICPTAVATQLMPEGFSAPQVPETAGEELGRLTGSWNLIADGMPIAPQEVTNAALWLASDASDYMTGTAFVMDAGFSCK